MDRRHRIGAMVVMIALVVALSATAATAAPAKGCDLITARELERVLGLQFTPNPVGATSCLWLSDDPARPAIIDVVADDSLPPKLIAGSKRSERKLPGAKLLKGIGDLAILAPLAKTDPTNDTTLSLIVYEGDVVGRLAVTTAGQAPTTKQMRLLGRILAKRL